MREPEQPLVSVVVPVLNAEADLPACLNALTRQSQPPFEIIVVDNGSTDRSREVAAQFPVRLVEEARPGAASARNRGVEAARGEIIAFTDADCAAARTWLAALTAEFRAPEVTVVAGRMVPFPQQDSPIVTYSALIGQYSAEASLQHPRFPYAPTACMALRKTVLNEVGGFDPDFLTYEGPDLFYRLHRIGLMRARYAPRAMLFYRTRATFRAFVRQNYRYGQGYGRFCHKHAADLEPALRSLPAHLGRWRSRTAVGCRKLIESGPRNLRSQLITLHVARETAQLAGTLRWRALGPHGSGNPMR